MKTPQKWSQIILVAPWCLTSVQVPEPLLILREGILYFNTLWGSVTLLGVLLLHFILTYNLFVFSCISWFQGWSNARWHQQTGSVFSLCHRDKKRHMIEQRSGAGSEGVCITALRVIFRLGTDCLTVEQFCSSLSGQTWRGVTIALSNAAWQSSLLNLKAELRRPLCFPVASDNCVRTSHLRNHDSLKQNEMWPVR